MRRWTAEQVNNATVRSGNYSALVLAAQKEMDRTSPHITFGVFCMLLSSLLSEMRCAGFFNIQMPSFGVTKKCPFIHVWKYQIKVTLYLDSDVLENETLIK